MTAEERPAPPPFTDEDRDYWRKQIATIESNYGQRSRITDTDELTTDRFAALLDRLDAAEQRIAELVTGPYEAKPCRGHWHVYVDGMEIVTDRGSVLGEQEAKAEAESLNAKYKQSVEAERSRADEAERRLAEIREAWKSHVAYITTTTLSPRASDRIDAALAASPESVRPEVTSE